MKKKINKKKITRLFNKKNIEKQIKMKKNILEKNELKKIITFINQL